MGCLKDGVGMRLVDRSGEQGTRSIFLFPSPPLPIIVFPRVPF